MNILPLRFIFVLFIGLSFIFSQLFPSLLYAKDDPTKNTEIFLNAVKNKNFDILLSLSFAGIKLSEIEKSKPSFDVPEKKARYLKECHKDFNKSYDVVYEGEIEGDKISFDQGSCTFLNFLKERLRGVTSGKKYVAIIGIPNVIRKI